MAILWKISYSNTLTGLFGLSIGPVPPLEYCNNPGIRMFFNSLDSKTFITTSLVIRGPSTTKTMVYQTLVSIVPKCLDGVKPLVIGLGRANLRNASITFSFLA